MTAKKLLALALAAFIVVGAGMWLAARQQHSGSRQSDLLYPQLKSQLNDITAVRIYTPGDVLSVELTRTDEGWRVAQRAGYWADEGKLRRLLLSLADAKLYEQKTSNPAQYGTLGVQDVSDKEASGIRLELVGPKQPVNLIVGEQGYGTQSHYVRRVGEPQSWLIDESLDTSSTANEWLRKEIVEVSADRIQSAQIAAKGEQVYTASKESKADANFAVTPLPKGKELSSASTANGIATALSGLTLSDVAPIAEFDTEPDSRATYRTFDGLVIEVRGWEREDKRHIALSAAFDQALADRFKVAAQSATNAEAEEPSADAAAESKTEVSSEASLALAPDAQAQAQEISRRVNGWVYEIPQYKYDTLFRPLSELLK